MMNDSKILKLIPKTVKPKNQNRNFNLRSICVILSIFSACLLTGSMLFVTFIRTEIWIVNYEITKLENYQDMLERKIRFLKLEKTMLKHSERINRIARMQFQLTDPKNIQLFLKSNK